MWKRESAGGSRHATVLLGVFCGCVADVSLAAEGNPPSKPWTLQQAFGSEQLKLSGSFRARYESISGQPRTNFRAEDELASLRTTLAAQYTLGAVRLGAEVWDSRAYLSERDSPISTSEVNALEVVQAYAAVDFKQPIPGLASASLQAGRMTMNVGSRRLVAFDDYRNTTNSFTGVRAVAKSGHGWSTDAFYTYPQLRRPDDLAGIRSNRVRVDDEIADTELWGLMITSPRIVLGGSIEGGVIGFREQDAPGRPTRNRSLRTWDVRYFRDPRPGQWDVEVEGALQLGGVRTGLAAAAPRRDVSATFFHGRIGYQWATPWKPRLALDYDYVSGDGRGAESHRFDTLFGMRRADFAPSGLYNLIGRANINSPGVRIEVNPTSRFDAMATYRTLWLASATDAFSTIGIRDASGNSGRFAGSQWDTRLRYWVIPAALRFEVNALYLDKGRFLMRAPNARRNNDVAFVAASLQGVF